jgi:hypothetical protein
MLRFRSKLAKNVNFLTNCSFFVRANLFSPSASSISLPYGHRLSSTSKFSSDIFPDVASTKKSATNSSASRQATTGDRLQNNNQPVDRYVNGKDFELKYPHSEYFVSNSSNVHDAREGGYIAINPEELKHYLPEGLPKGLREEFELTESHSMMVRDMNKVMCRVIEEYEEKLQPSLNPNIPKNGPTSSYSTRLSLRGLTNRPEWPKSMMKTYYYGKELVIPRKWAVEPLVAVKGPESISEKTVANIVSAAQSIPNKIMLTG